MADESGDEDPILAMLKDEVTEDLGMTSDNESIGTNLVDEEENVESFRNINLSENCQIIIIVLLLLILFKEEIMKNKFVKSILN